MPRNKETVRHYKDDYLKFGYSFVLNKQSIELPLCLYCKKTRKNEAMVPSKLKNHFDTQHAENQMSFDQLKKMHTEQQEINKKTAQKQGHSVNKRIQLFTGFLSYMAAFLVAKSSVSYNVPEKLLKPFLLEMFAAMKKYKIKRKHISKKVISRIPLSRNTIKRRVETISNNLEEQLLDDLVKSPIGHAFQADSSTDVDNREQLVGFVSYEKNGSIKREMLFLKEIPLHANAATTFGVIEDYYRNNALSMDDIHNNTADGCSIMMGRKTGVLTQMKRAQVESNAQNNHCILHRLSIATKFITDKIKKVLDDATKVINFVKNSALNVRLLRRKAQASESKATSLLFYRDVRWLSLGQATNRLIEMNGLVLELIYEKMQDAAKVKVKEVAKMVKEKNFWSILSYLSDTFRVFNISCKKMQGDCVNIFQTRDAINLALKNVSLMIEELEGEREMVLFKNLKDHNLDEDTKKHLIGHLKEIKQRIQNGCSDESILDRFGWVEDPFICEINNNEEMENIRNTPALKTQFTALSLYDFWLECEDVAPNLSKTARQCLSFFPTSYLCERAFSLVNHIKSKKRNRLDVQHQLRIKLSGYYPQLDKLAENTKTRRSKNTIESDDSSSDSDSEDNESIDSEAPSENEEPPRRTLRLRVRN